MKKTYTEPELEVVLVEASDVLTASVPGIIETPEDEF